MATESTVTQNERPAYLLRTKAEYYRYIGQYEENAAIQGYHIMSGILYAAFAYEAMLFHYAQHYRPSIKDSIQRTDVQKIIRTEGGLDPHFFTNNAHCKIMEQCIEARDSIVHGKPVTRTVPMPIPEGAEDAQRYQHMMDRPLAIQEMCTLEALQAYLIALCEVEREIEHQAVAPGMIGRTTLEGERYQVSLWPLSICGMRVTRG
ncbi:hypothetical protein TW86_03820 [Halomonas sp. S2151]|uniref:hypothetical protein n=1 Tax=Halomonas sp. S2151 TaxID=579478 RepID=UPI0005FA739E|nr:hypothetical protein [Halomonas sp. S2151]KJZ17394.1 hypothetical protein TW86_03820 [Halomonas sp. S2151]